MLNELNLPAAFRFLYLQGAERLFIYRLKIRAMFLLYLLMVSHILAMEQGTHYFCTRE